MATGTQGTAARDVKMPVSQVISYVLFFNAAGAASGIPIGIIPANAVIQSWRATVETGFNAGSTNPITIGVTPTGAEIAAAASITSGTPGCYTGSAAAAAGWKQQTADQTLYCAYIPTGGAASAGKAIVVIHYIVTDNG